MYQIQLSMDMKTAKEIWRQHEQDLCGCESATGADMECIQAQAFMAGYREKEIKG